MTSHVLYTTLDKPIALDDTSWAAVLDPFTRLQGAVSTDDRPLIVGSAKDLVEAVARVVLGARGQPAGSDMEFDAALGAAHRAIEYQPGSGLAMDAPVRQAAMQARKLASQLRELRNAYGVGHGRSSVPVIEDDVLDVCVDAALLWTRWALRRLQSLILGSLQPLINELRSGQTFRAGDLAVRLDAADLRHLDVADQRLLGLTVGQRAATNTFTVRFDGVEACAASQDDVAWPAGYREGIAEGLFVDAAGQVHVDEHAFGPRLAAEVLVPHPEVARVVADLETTLKAAAWSPWFAPMWQTVVAEMRSAEGVFTSATAQQSWRNIADYFQQSGTARDAGSR